MRLSPIDIEHMEFPRGTGGYQKRHVRDFLERVAAEVADLLREMQAMQNELDTARSRISELQTAEAELQRAVIAAERIGNEIKENAKREAKGILAEAERVRAARLSELDSLVDRSRADLDRLMRERSLFREQFKGLLSAYMRSLEATYDHDEQTGGPVPLGAESRHHRGAAGSDDGGRVDSQRIDSQRADSQRVDSQHVEGEHGEAERVDAESAT